MAQFRGTVQGHRGQASRLGSKSSGLDVDAQSWEGAVKTRLWHETLGDNDSDFVRVTMHKHYGQGEERVLYYGPVGQYRPQQVDRDLAALRERVAVLAAQAQVAFANLRQGSKGDYDAKLEAFGQFEALTQKLSTLATSGQ